MADGMIEVARATVTLVPNMQGSQGEITTQLTGVARQASQQAGEEGGRDFGERFAGALRAGAAAIGAALTAATAAAVATGAAFLNATSDVAAFGNEIDKNSRKLGMSSTAYQEWDFILEHAGASIDGMKNSMRRLTTAAQEGSDAFTALGLSQAELSEMSPEEVWNATITALQGVEDESQRVALASDLLGRGATELAPLFDMTAEETEALRQQVHELGGIMDEDGVAAAAQYEDQLQNLKVSLRGLKVSMLSQFMPGISRVMEGLSNIFAGNGGIDMVREGLDSVVNSMTEVAPQFFEITNTVVNSILSGFAPMLPSLATAIFDFIDQGIVTFTRMIPQLTPVITTGLQRVGRALFNSLPTLLRALIEMTQGVVEWLASGNNVRMLADGLIELTAILANSLADVLPVLLPAIVNIISQVAQSLTTPQNVNMILDAVNRVVVSVLVALARALPEIGGLIVETCRNLAQHITNFLSNVMPIITNGVNRVQSIIQTWKTNIINIISNLISTVRTNITNWITNLGASFRSGFDNIRTNISNIISNIREMVNRVVNTISNLPDRVVSIGRNLVTGLWNGINDKVGWVVDKIRGMGTRITNAIREVLGIHSPSRVWADQVGQYLPLGLYEGYSDSMDDVQDEIVRDMNGFTAEMSANVQANGVQGAAVYDSDTVNLGNVSINIYAAEGSSPEKIADMVAVKLEEMTRRRGAVYA